MKVPSPVLGSIGQVQDSVNPAGSIGLQKQADSGDKSSGGGSDIHNQEHRTEYNSSRDRGPSSEPVYNKALFQHKLAKNAKSLLRNSTDVCQEQLIELLEECDSQDLSLIQSTDFIPFDNLEKGMYVIEMNKNVE